MRDQQPSHEPGDPAGHRCLADWLTTLVDGLGYNAEILLRDDLGERRIRDMAFPLFVALATLTILAVLGGVFGLPPVPAGGPPPWFWLLFFIQLSVLLHLRQRIRAWRRRRKGGTPTHSYYTGRPELFRFLHRRVPGLTEQGCKRWGDPLLATAFAAATMPFCIPVGLYLLLAAAAVQLTFLRRAVQDREMVLDATDGVLDMLTLQENLADEHQAASRPAAAARVVTPVTAPPPAPARPRPTPAAPRPTSPPPVVAPRQPAAAPPSPAVPDELCKGLSDNLLGLLREERREE